MFQDGRVSLEIGISKLAFPPRPYPLENWSEHVEGRDGQRNRVTRITIIVCYVSNKPAASILTTTG